MKKLSSIILLLTMTAVSTLAQMKSANLDPGAWYTIIAVHSGKALEIAGGEEGKAGGQQLQQNERLARPTSSSSLNRSKADIPDHRQTQRQGPGNTRWFAQGHTPPFSRPTPLGQDQQLFALVKETTGNYRIIARLTGYGFDVLGGVKSLATTSRWSSILRPEPPTKPSS